MREVLIVLFVCCLPLSCGGGEVEVDEGVRAIWITRFDYLTEEDVLAAVDQSADAGFNTLMFQVRGNATTFFPSSHEPWAEQFEWKDPGFDPLGVAVARAHELGVELHAWVNVVPGWWGPVLPEDESHLYYTHPEWFWYDQHGERQALSERFYVSLNPCLPEVREHIVKTVGEIVKAYDIDGLHLDYIRFPNEAPATPAGTDIDYPRDERTVALFREETGKEVEEDEEAWNRWRTESITTLLRELRGVAKAAGREVSAAVGPIPERALHHFQDVETWLKEGLLDAVYPMNYAADEKVFGERLELWKELGKGQRVVMGCMLANAEIDVRQRQVEQAREVFGGICVFAYSSLFDSPNVDIDSQDEETRVMRKERRERFVPLIRGMGGE